MSVIDFIGLFALFLAGALFSFVVTFVLVDILTPSSGLGGLVPMLLFGGVVAVGGMLFLFWLGRKL